MVARSSISSGKDGREEIRRYFGAFLGSQGANRTDRQADSPATTPDRAPVGTRGGPETTARPGAGTPAA